MVRNYIRKTEDRWSKQDLLEALTNIHDRKVKINDAAKLYGISRATLYRQYKKFLQAGGKCDVNELRCYGGTPILTKIEEDVLKKTVLDLREQGFCVNSSDVKRICFEYCETNGIPNQFNNEKRMASDDWYYGYLKRHPDARVGEGVTVTQGARPTGVVKVKKMPVLTKEETSKSPSKAGTSSSSSGFEIIAKKSKPVAITTVSESKKGKKAPKKGKLSKKGAAGKKRRGKGASAPETVVKQEIKADKNKEEMEVDEDSDTKYNEDENVKYSLAELAASEKHETEGSVNVKEDEVGDKEREVTDEGEESEAKEEAEAVDADDDGEVDDEEADEEAVTEIMD